MLRVHNLAKELGVTSKQIIDKCHAEGIELKNHMAALPAGLAQSIREWFSEGEDITSVEVAESVNIEAIRSAAQRKAERAHAATKAGAAVAVPSPEAPPEKQLVPELGPAAPAVALEERPAAAVVLEAAPAPVEALPVPVRPEPPLAPVGEPSAVPMAPTPVEPVVHVPSEPEVLRPAAKHEPPAPAERLTTILAPPSPPPAPIPIVPAGPKLVPRPAELQGPRIIRIEAPEPLRPVRRSTTAPPPAVPTTESPRTAPGRRGRVRGRTQEEEAEALRLRTHSPRRTGRGVAEIGERVQEWRDQDLLERKERLASATGHGLKDRRAAEQRRQAAAAATAAPGARKAPIAITAPITLKEYCAAIGAPFAQVSMRLLEHTQRAWTINQTLDAETAELIALDLGLAVTVAKQKTALENLQDEFAHRERHNLVSRPPVVAMLGHVDHGKTSLLDAIRDTAVAKGEAGGITQHIGAYRLERDGWRVTFLDTPGHEAFTALRARGANLTDVVVLVVAADDGVMPQTVEALNHARAAGVQIVVALNKIDLPNVDMNRVYAQLSEHGLVPTEWGGTTDVIKTSAVTGEGIDELVAHLSTLSELLDLRADPDVPVCGAVIEAQMREGQGVVAHVLVREGTLRPGQCIVCGGAAGRVRTLRDDHGRIIKQAHPGWPVQVSGLDIVPAAGDPLYQVADLKLAKAIAEEVQAQRRQEQLDLLRKPRTLERLLAASTQPEIPELNIILRADVQGSVDVLKKTLGEFPQQKAQLRLLQASVGTISEADVQLARASNAIIIGFSVVPEERARQMAEQFGVEIRTYRVIYEMLDDMHKALAGLLEPLRREEVRGTAEVRQVFNISRVGVVAGCLVTSGTVVRNHRARLVRDGRIVVEGRALQSLKRFKDDAREVRSGMECGIKLDGFDDLKPGDVIETYEIVEELQDL